MLDLFTGYSLSQIIIMTIGLSLAAKGCWELVDFFKSKYKAKFSHDYDKKKMEEQLDEKINKLFDNQNSFVTTCQKFNDKLDEIQFKIDKANNRIDELTESDMYDIKYCIVQAYHYFVEEQGWIDDFSLSTLEARYKIYKMEGGNSFIHDLMSELRSLPHHPSGK